MIKDIELSSLFKVKITDAKITRGDGKRSLLVDLEVSSSGKVTNGRIYPPKGHRINLDTWTKPYAKPVLIYHDDHKDPIGRFVSIQWIDTEKEALAFLGGDISALADVKRAYDNPNPQETYKVLKKNGALDKKWPGLGKLIGKVRITDQDAIDKLLDGRYQTWSAGQGTDAFVCMNCGSEWHKGDMCDHRLGGVDEDGNPVVFMCGNMSGQEVSVVNNPANDSSITLKMEFEDSSKEAMTVSMLVKDSTEESEVVNIQVDFEPETIMIKDLQTLELKTVLEILSDEAKLAEFKDALSGDSVFEIQWLIRVHDLLHAQYDFELKYRDEQDLSLPAAVFKLHGMIHDLSQDKEFRDSMMNGFLDHYGPDGAKDDSYVLALPSMDDKVTETKLTDTLDKDALVQEILAKLAEAYRGNKEKEDQAQKEDEVVVLDVVEDDTISWDVLDLAVTTLVPQESRLSDAARAALAASAFCGKSGTLPVHDAAYIQATRTLVAKTKLSDAQKTAILDCVARHEAKLAAQVTPVEDKTCKCENCKCKESTTDSADHAELKVDYTAALKKIEDLEGKLLGILKAHKAEVDVSATVDDTKLDLMLDWFDNVEVESDKAEQDNQTDKSNKGTLEHPNKGLTPVESPNSVTADHTATDSKLTNFQKSIVTKYKDTLTKDGEYTAAAYYRTVAKYLPSDFDITKYADTRSE